MNSFRCNVSVVCDIIAYELRRGVNRIDVNEVLRIRSHLERLRNKASGGTHVGYEEFMCVLPNFVSCKLGIQFGQFTKTFMHRMRFYRMGRDWRTLHVNQPIGAYAPRSPFMSDIEIGMLLVGNTSYIRGINHGM